MNTAENEGYSSNINTATQNEIDTPSTCQSGTNVSESPNSRTTSRVRNTLTLSRKRRLNDDDTNVMLQDAYRLLQNTAKTDHFDTFGNHVASELRKYDIQIVPHVKKAIMDILFQADTGQFFYVCQGYYTSGFQARSSSIPSPPA